MRPLDWAVLLGCSVIGWALVSWLIGVIRQQRAPPLAIGALPPPATSPASGATTREIADSWHTILGVEREASLPEIEAAYRARLAECDRVLLNRLPGTSEQRDAESRRALIEAAYGFIKPVRQR
jgi:hypothetical protein